MIKSYNIWTIEYVQSLNTCVLNWNKGLIKVIHQLLNRVLYVASISPINYLNFIVVSIKVSVKKILVGRKNVRRLNYTIIWFNLTFLLIKTPTPVNVDNFTSNIFGIC